jgi:hypothetical protein
MGVDAQNPGGEFCASTCQSRRFGREELLRKILGDNCAQLLMIITRGQKSADKK